MTTSRDEALKLARSIMAHVDDFKGPVASQDDLDYFMEYAILSKDLRDLADRARAIRTRERRLAELAREIANVLKYEGMDGDIAIDWIRRYEEAVK